jgi:uncharacterized protein YjiS (DUF1127 family)
MIMSTISNSAVPREALVGAFFQSMGRALANVWVAYLNWRIEQLAINRLRSMSDRELKDIGVSRATIEFSVRDKTDRLPIVPRFR